MNPRRLPPSTGHEHGFRTTFTGRISEANDIIRALHQQPHRSFIDTLQGLGEDDPHHPPLYYLLARVSASLFGDSIASLRAFAVFIGILVVPSGYFLGRQLFKRQLPGLTFSALLAISPFFVLYSQEVREYSLWAIWILLSHLYLLRALDSSTTHHRLVNWSLYCLCITLGFYTSVLMALVVFSQAIYVVLASRLSIPTVASFLATLIAAGLAFSPWLAIFVKNYWRYKASNAWMLRPTSLEDAITRAGVNISRIFVVVNDDHSDKVWIYMLIFLICSIFVRLVYLLIRNSRSGTEVFILCITLVPFISLALPDMLFGGIRSQVARYLVPTWIGILLIVTYFISDNKNHGWRKVLISLIAVGSVAANLYGAQAKTTWTKDLRLPRIAEMIDREDNAIVVSDWRGYNFGNLFALAYFLDPHIKIQALRNIENYELPSGFKYIFFLNLSETFKETLMGKGHVKIEDSFNDGKLWLWKVEVQKY